MFDVVIRPAAEDDYPDIVSVWRESGLSVRPQGRDRREAFVAQLARFPKSYLVAQAQGRVVGVVLGTHDGRKGWINRLAVLPAYQRRGVASALVAACEQALRASGIGITAALVEPHSAASAALFDRLGYATDVPVLYFRKLESSEI